MNYSHDVVVLYLLYIQCVHCNVLLTLLLINLRVTSHISEAFTHGVSIRCKRVVIFLRVIWYRLDNVNSANIEVSARIQVE